MTALALLLIAGGALMIYAALTGQSITGELARILSGSGRQGGQATGPGKTAHKGGLG